MVDRYELAQVLLASSQVEAYKLCHGTFMQSPPLDPNVADLAPDTPSLTPYDEQHVVTYMRLLDAEADDANWREVALLVLHIDPAREPDRARRAFESHLARAKWMTSHGYRHLLRAGDQKKEK